MAKKLRRAALGLTKEWYKSVLSEDQHKGLTNSKVKEADKDSFEYIYDLRGCRILPASCIRSFYQSLKKAYYHRLSDGKT